jgi:predicted Zn-dependent protease
MFNSKGLFAYHQQTGVDFSVTVRTVVKNLFYSRFGAQKKGVKATPFPPNGIMEGGTATIDEMIRDTQRGILVTPR